MSILRILPVFIVATVLLGAFSTQVTAAGKHHRLAIHVDENDKVKMKIVLNNVENVTKYYEEKGDTIDIEVVAHGPGLIMLREDKSPVKQRIAAMSLELGNVSFSACGNTMKVMKKKEGKDIPLISEATRVPAGVVRLIELQEGGWSYVKP